MIGSLVKGSLLGGVVLFVWSAVSWMALPWHRQSLATFTDEPAVLAAIEKAAPASGVYLLPNPMPADAALTKDQRKAVHEKAMEQIRKGPSGALMIIHKEGMDMSAMNVMMIRALAIGGAASLALTFLVVWAGIGGFLGRMLFVLVAGVAGGGAHILSEWNWWATPQTYTVYQLADLAIGWALAGLAIASVTGKRKK